MILDPNGKGYSFPPDVNWGIVLREPTLRLLSIHLEHVWVRQCYILDASTCACACSVCDLDFLTDVINSISDTVIEIWGLSTLAHLYITWQNFPSRGIDGYIDGSVQERRNSIANALELRLSCTNPSIYPYGPRIISYCTKYILWRMKTDIIYQQHYRTRPGWIFALAIFNMPFTIAELNTAMLISFLCLFVVCEIYIFPGPAIAPEHQFKWFQIELIINKYHYVSYCKRTSLYFFMGIHYVDSIDIYFGKNG